MFCKGIVDRSFTLENNFGWSSDANEFPFESSWIISLGGKNRLNFEVIQKKSPQQYKVWFHVILKMKSNSRSSGVFLCIYIYNGELPYLEITLLPERRYYPRVSVNGQQFAKCESLSKCHHPFCLVFWQKHKPFFDSHINMYFINVKIYNKSKRKHNIFKIQIFPFFSETLSW